MDFAPQDVQTMVANLMKALGKQTNVKYYCDGTESDYEKQGLGTLNHFGYTVENPRGHDWKYVVNSLNNNKLVAANGKSYKGKTWIFFNKYWGGHAWVIDGYIEQEKQVEVIEEFWDYYPSSGRQEFLYSKTSTTTERRTLLRMNWGWAGINAGYFALDSFDSNSPIVKSGEEGDFQYKKLVAAVYRR